MSIDAKLLKHPYAWIALGFGSGLSPKAPGTAGSLLAVLLWWLLMADQPLMLQLAVILAGFALGVYASNWMIAHTGIQDPGFIVWDEFIGQWLALLLLPKTLLWYAVAFALFRLFDIVKRGPVGWADRRFKGGFGVMFDDVLAGLLAMGVGYIASRFLAL
ncbi:MAG: phosphatidylglycerophosphatase A [Arenimonas sp.]|nr:phosphatidylglycerophosphatase A [Arenimonas sp.]MBP7981682.1 phosphatidylglycerophosphatase A [Arenimonas sp.]